MSERQESLDQLLVYVRALKKPLQIVAQNDYARLESIKGLDQTVVAVIDKALELPFTPGQSELLREIRGQFARFSIMKLAEQRSAVGTSLQTLKVLERQLGVEPSESKPAEARAVEPKSTEARAAEPKAPEARAVEPKVSEARPAQPSRAEKNAEREKRASDGGRRDGKAKEGRGEKVEKGEKAEPKAEKSARSDLNDKELIERSPVRQSGGGNDSRERSRSKNGKERERDKRSSREKERAARNEARSAGATRVEERRTDPVVTAAPYVERDDQDLTWGRPRRLLVYQEEPILFLPPPLQEDETEEPSTETSETEASNDRASRRAARNHEFRQNRNERRDKHKRSSEGRSARGNTSGEAEKSVSPAAAASASTGQERRSSRDERSDRSSRDDRGSRDERSDRSSRDDRGNRDERSDRSSRDDRSNRDERSDRSSRDDRSNRDERGNRNHRNERGGRDERGNREERQGARPEREGRGHRDERRRRERPRGERRAPAPVLELPDEPLPAVEFGPEDELLAASGLIEEIVPEGAISRFSPEYRALRLAQLQAEQAAQQAVSEEEASDEASDEDVAEEESTDVLLAHDVSDDMTAPDPVVVALDVEPPDLDELRKFDDAPVAEEFPPNVEGRPDLYPPVEDEEVPSFDTDGDSEEGLEASDDELTVDLEDEAADDVHDEDESDDDDDESDDEDESDDDEDEDDSDDDDEDEDDDSDDDDEDESDDDEDEDDDTDDDDEDEDDSDDDDGESDEDDDDDDEDESDDDDDEDESDDDDDDEDESDDDDDEDESDDASEEGEDDGEEEAAAAEHEGEPFHAAAETSPVEASEMPPGSVAAEGGASTSLSGDAPQSSGGVGSVGLLAIAQVLSEVLNREPQPAPERTEDELNRLLATEAPDVPTPGDLSLISDDLTVHEVLVEVVESAARRSTLELARISAEHSMGAVEADSDDEAEGDDEEGSDADEAESTEASAGESRGRRRRRRRRRGGAGREQAVQAQEAVPTPPAPVLPVVSAPASVSPAAVAPMPHAAELSASRAERRAEAQKLLETPLSDPSVIGHRMGAILEGQGLKTVQDLLFFFPRSWLDRRVMRTISSLPIGEAVVFQASVDLVEMNYDDRSRNLQVRFSDLTGTIEAVWPNVRSNYLRNRFRQGGNVLVWGIVEEQDGRPLLVNPETELLGNDEEDTLSTGRIVPVYPSIEGLGQKTVRRLIKQVLGLFKGELPDPIPTSIRYRANVLPLEQALNEAHFPSAETDFTALEQRQTLALRTLIFADLLSLELALAHRRKALANETGMNLAIHQAKVARLLRRMGPLTDAERQVLEDVKRDLASPHPMARLLLTDIGRAHKLMYLAIALAVEGEGQVAIIVPSENLVDQYAAVVREQLAPLKLEVDALTGAVRGRVRERLIHRLRRGEISVVIGTHALFNEGVGFKRLTLAVLDEQHRGSMIPRKQLQRRGFNPNLLVLNSAPMPRALLQTIYGDITWSRLPSAMPEEPPFSTRVVVADNRVECEASIRASLARGHQLLYVSPEEGGTAVDDPVRLEELAKKLRNEVFPGAQVGVFSHRLLPPEQELILKQLRTRQLQIVVTSPELDLRLPGYNLSSIVVERAELLTPLHLHALRSMLLASYNPANFYMVPGPEVTPEELEALTQLQEQYDGFVLAEQELQVRGVPELMGLRQLGISPAMSADLVTHGELVDVARREAFRWMDGCPEAEQPDLHKPLMSLVKMRWAPLLEGLTFE